MPREIFRKELNGIGWDCPTSQLNDPLTIICGDALTKLRELPSESVQCCVTSPPFWGLRD